MTRLLAFLLLCLPIFAQTPTAVTATITDSNGAPYAFGSYTISLTDASGNTAHIGGVVLPASFVPNLTGKLSASGALAVSLLPNAYLQAGSLWKFKVCSTGFAGQGAECFVSSQAITGSSQSLSVALSALAPSQAIALPPVSLPADPVLPDQAVTKRYVDARAAEGGTTPSAGAVGSIQVAAPGATFGALPAVLSSLHDDIGFQTSPQVQAAITALALGTATSPAATDFDAAGAAATARAAAIAASDPAGSAAAAQTAAINAANAAMSAAIAALNLDSASTKAAVTSVGSPGVDTNVPTEKAVRAAIDSVGTLGGTIGTYAAGPAAGNSVVTTAPLAGAVQRTQNDKNNDIPSIKDYGAKGDMVKLVCSLPISSNALACSTAAFSALGIVGKSINFEAGVGSYTATIATFVDSQHVTLSSSNTLASFTAHTAFYGTDDTAAFNAVGSAGLAIPQFIVPAGNYLITSTVSLGLQKMIGSGGTLSQIYCAPNGVMAAPCFVWDYPTINAVSFQAGISDLVITGPGAVTQMTGVKEGGTNGAIGMTIERSKVSNFFVGLEIANNTYDVLISHSYLDGSARNVYISPATTAGGESIKFDHTIITHGGPSSTDVSSCIDVETGTFILSFEGGSIVECQLHVGAGISAVIVGKSVHMERPSNATQPFFDIGGGFVLWDGDIVFGSGTGSVGPITAINAYGNAEFTSNYLTIGTQLGNHPSIGTVSGNASIHIGGKIRKLAATGFASVIVGTSTGASYVMPQPQPTVSSSGSITTFDQTQDMGYCGSGIAPGFLLPLNPFTGERITVKSTTATPCTVGGNGSNIAYAGNSVTTVTIYAFCTMTFNWEPNGAFWWVTLGDQNISNALKIVGAAQSTAIIPAGITTTGGNASFTATAGAVNLTAGTGFTVSFTTNSVIRWFISSTGAFLANTDNSWDIGASGVNRPRNVYIATLTPGNLVCAGTGGLLTTSGCASVIGGSENPSFSATPSFSPTVRASIMTLAGNVTGFTITGGAVDGQGKVIVFCQPATGGPFTVATPFFWKNWQAISATASTCTAETATWSLAQSAWIGEDTSGGSYSLPISTTLILGGVKVDGSTVTIDPVTGIITAHATGGSGIGSFGTFATRPATPANPTIYIATDKPRGAQLSVWDGTNWTQQQATDGTGASLDGSGNLTLDPGKVAGIGAANHFLGGSTHAASEAFNGGLTSTISTAAKVMTTTACASGASPAVCVAAPSGFIAVASGATTLTVATTVVTGASQIQLTPDASVGAALGVTCDTAITSAQVTNKTAATSFTFSVATAPVSGKASCFAYTVIN